MRCLGPLTACIVGPLALTAGASLFLGSLVCVAFFAGNRAPGNGRATPDDETAEGRTGAPDAAARARRRRAL
jgi:hypothetical protein